LIDFIGHVYDKSSTPRAKQFKNEKHHGIQEMFWLFWQNLLKLYTLLKLLLKSYVPANLKVYISSQT